MGGVELVGKRRREGDQRATGPLKRKSRRREGEGRKESFEREEKRKETFLRSRVLRTQERGEI